MSFYNTIHAEKQMLMMFDIQAQALEIRIEEIFKGYPNDGFTWFEVKSMLEGTVHEGSVKRAITDLKTRGVVYKTDVMVLSPYKKPAHRYKLITK